MKVMFIVYHDIRTEARSQEILECAKKLGETIFVSYSKPFDYMNVKHIITGNGSRNYFAFIIESINAIKEENPDVVILHDEYTAIILKWLVKHRKNTFIIYDSSELYIDRKPQSIKMKIASFMGYYEKKYLKYADIVISANIERAKIMKEYFNLNEIPIVFDNVHRIDDDYDVEECNKKFGHLFADDLFCIVYAGGIKKQRMTFELAKAVGELGKNYRLIVVGASTEQDKKRFYNMLQDENITNVFYEGFIQRNELRYMFSRAKVSVSAFAQDTVNNINCASGKLYESLFEGTPILTSENPPLKRICSDYGVGVSNNNFKEGILELEKNYNYYRNNVYEYIKNIDVNSRIDKLASIINERLQLNNK
ncbi:MAG TPA: glycosyltransferase family 4 protein [Clostridiaceae bacterium]|nr:glycosyltransferase family 4 protein [Clostridiaceae bacterium]